LHIAELRMGSLGKEPACREVGIVEDLIVGLDEAARDPGRLDLRDPGRGAIPRGDFLDDGDELAPVLVAEVVLEEAWIGLELRKAQHVAERFPELLRVGATVNQPSSARRAW